MRHQHQLAKGAKTSKKSYGILEFFGITLCSLFYLSLLSSCQTTEPPSKDLIPEIVPRTIMTDSTLLKKQTYAQDSQIISIPGSLLNQRITKRPYVELRQGPGIQFALLPRILERNTNVIAIGSHEQWTKVLLQDSKTIGWVHSQTLKPIRRPKQSVIIPRNILPKVFSTKKTTHAYAYNNKSPILLNLPKGTPFYTLKRNRDNILVIIGETNSVIWLSKKDVL